MSPVDTNLLLFRESLRLALEVGRHVDRTLLPDEQAHVTRVVLSITESAEDTLNRLCNLRGIDEYEEESGGSD